MKVISFRRVKSSGTGCDDIHIYSNGSVIAWHDTRFSAQYGEVFEDLSKALTHYGLTYLDPSDWHRSEKKVNCKPCIFCKSVLPLNDTWDEHVVGCEVGTKMKMETQEP